MLSSSWTTNELLQFLNELAMDLHWTWSHTTDKIWRQLNPVLWELTHNPLVVIQTASQKNIVELLEDPLVREIVDELIQVKRQNSISPAWFQKEHPNALLTNVAYFSMEFMLSEALPIYSGGLGNVAGDHLKTASDLGVPVTGIGLLYQQGYPRQVLYADGTQQNVAPYNDPGQLPITPLRNAEGEWLRIEVKLPGYSVWLRTWKAQVGRVQLLLLDSNDSANFPIHRGITSELYGGDAEIRLMQELVLGIGGWRLLKALDIKPQICHINEGHAAFMIVERVLDFMEECKLSFSEALDVTRSGNIFTTHTAVGAGLDHFPPSLIEKYLSYYIRERLKISIYDFLALGRQNPDDQFESFNTGYLAIKGSSHINGVSRLHGEVSRQLFAPLFPRWPLEEIPIGHVTNGVHMPTWDSPEADKLWTETCGKDRWLGSLKDIELNIRNIPDKRLWEFRTTSKEIFINEIRNRYARQMATIGMPYHIIEDANKIFDPNVLTLGFARRFASYKRPYFLLIKPDRLKGILMNCQKPVQLIISGKAHASDWSGQAMIREWFHFINDPDVNQKVIFLSDYDMLLTENMVQGVDLWINTPRRPWEACGTSGMKVLVNGGLNLSELDGWWDEAYSEELGWAIGDRYDHTADASWDDKEAKQLYDMLEYEIIPDFYNRNQDGVPEAWVKRIRESMAQLTPQFSANRSLREYTEHYYLPMVDNYLQRTENKGEFGRMIGKWKTDFLKKWNKLRFGNTSIINKGNRYYFIVELYLNRFKPSELKVELYANSINRNEPFRQPMKLEKTGSSEMDVTIYTAEVLAESPQSYFTPRVLPVNNMISIPLECPQILWLH